MTEREIKITKALLDALHELDGAQAGEITLHADVNLRVECSATEFADVLKSATNKKWVNALPSRLTGKNKYNLTDAGAAARLEF
jgi:hypothetical protein